MIELQRSIIVHIPEGLVSDIQDAVGDLEVLYTNFGYPPPPTVNGILFRLLAGYVEQASTAKFWTYWMDYGISEAYQLVKEMDPSIYAQDFFNRTHMHLSTLGPYFALEVLDDRSIKIKEHAHYDPSATEYNQRTIEYCAIDARPTWAYKCLLLRQRTGSDRRDTIQMHQPGINELLFSAPSGKT